MNDMASFEMFYGYYSTVFYTWVKMGVRLGFFSLFISGLCGRMELYLLAARRSARPGTTSPQYSHTKPQPKSQGAHNQKCHSKSSSSHHRQWPSQNHTIYRLPKNINKSYMRHNNIFRFNIPMRDLVIMQVLDSRCDLFYLYRYFGLR